MAKSMPQSPAGSSMLDKKILVYPHQMSLKKNQYIKKSKRQKQYYSKKHEQKLQKLQEEKIKQVL